MERSEKDLKKMCWRLVRFEESRIRMKRPNVSLKLKIHKKGDGLWYGVITENSETGSCYPISLRSALKLEVLLVEFIYWISYDYSLLDIHLSDGYDTILEPGMFEELDLKLSSLGF